MPNRVLQSDGHTLASIADHWEVIAEHAAILTASELSALGLIAGRIAADLLVRSSNSAHRHLILVR